ncbi:thioredoxin-like protein [Xylariaceae sp. FL1651]|nr:thioredoxin-like protein [Xylariaceae sp. FL1651]
MASSKIVLFDLASKEPCKAWSLNPWKIRLLLNFKGLDYETQWLEYPDIKPRLKEHFPKDQESFTIPTVIMPDGTYIMDSWKIAQALEEQYPSPSLHLDSPLRQKSLDILSEAQKCLRPIYMVQVPKRLLKEYNYAYWKETREKSAGMPLDQFEKEQGGEKAYNAAAPHLQKLTAMLKENNQGPFYMGETVSYTDFIHAGFLIFFRRIGDDAFQSLLKATGDPDVHLKLLEAVKPWSERDDH